jgi:DNA-directed RNA polymerase specialized sigma24 family protein
MKRIALLTYFGLSPREIAAKINQPISSVNAQLETLRNHIARETPDG